jgi:hypothetical protein
MAASQAAHKRILLQTSQLTAIVGVTLSKLPSKIQPQYAAIIASSLCAYCAAFPCLMLLLPPLLLLIVQVLVCSRTCGRMILSWLTWQQWLS